MIATATLLLAATTLASGSQPADPLEDGLAAIDAGKIAADLRFLSDDELGGRNSPSASLRHAAAFIANRLNHLGFTPAGDPEASSFLDPFPLHQRGVSTRATYLEAQRGDSSLRLAFAEDFFFHSSWDVTDHDRSGEVVYCGAGERSDFDGLDLEGRWALCVDSDLKSGLRRRYAMRAGALGLVVWPPADYEGEPMAERFARTVALADPEGRVNWPEEGGRPRLKEVFPYDFLSLNARRKLAFFAGLEGEPEVGETLPFSFHERRRLPGDGGRIEVHNVCGLWPGSDPELAREVIVVSAHYDHVGRDSAGEIYNGADDNGSGTSGLLALADGLVAYGPLRRSVLLIWVSAEEKGLWGAKAWADEPTLPEGYRAVCNVNVDMIGRNAEDELYITPSRELTREYNGLVQRFEEASFEEGFPELGQADRYYERSDHAEFARLDIPVAFLFAGEHEDYHKITDTFDKIDFDKIRRVMRLVLRTLDDLQSDELDL